MTLPAVFHEDAESELNEASAYYEQTRRGLGTAFLSEVEQAIDTLTTSPLVGVEVEKGVRWWLVDRFPYSVLYQVRDDHIQILAIAHQRRRPFYWRGRR